MEATPSVERQIERARERERESMREYVKERERERERVRKGKKMLRNSEASFYIISKALNSIDIYS